MQLNGSQIFVEVLCEQGVDTIFGYPGGAVLNLYDELYKNADRITHVLTAHEQGAAHAADGYARATGRTGVVLATSGPGATNLVTGIATAYMDSVPMVAFTGNVATPGIGKDSFQEAYIEGITMPITKHNFTVRRVEDLADTMRAYLERRRHYIGRGAKHDDASNQDVLDPLGYERQDDRHRRCHADRPSAFYHVRIDTGHANIEGRKRDR